MNKTLWMGSLLGVGLILLSITCGKDISRELANDGSPLGIFSADDEGSGSNAAGSGSGENNANNGNPNPSPISSPTPLPSPVPSESRICGNNTGFELLSLNRIPISEIVVVDNVASQRTAQAILRIKDGGESGLYQIFNLGPESGSIQWNESSYLQISNQSLNQDGFPLAQPDPLAPNCGKDFIVQDDDNESGPTTKGMYFGTFPLSKDEDNVITLSHYCPIFRQGRCLDFHNRDSVNNRRTNCDATRLTANSVHFRFDNLCVYKL